MALRELKAWELAARTRITLADGGWLVPAQGGRGTYRVTLGSPPRCDGDDFLLRQRACKHILAARFVCARDHGGTAPALDTEAIPRPPTYQQNWPVYNEAQQTEKHRFEQLLFELCRGLPDLGQTGPGRRWTPLAGPGRRWTPLADMVLACGLKVSTTLSSRRFAGDLKDAYPKGYRSSLRNSVSACAFLEKDQLTAVLRDLIVQSSLPLARVETRFAPDATGFSAARFVRWFDEKYGCERSGRDWVKAHAIRGAKTGIVTAVEVGERDANGSPFFKALVEKTAENFTVQGVPADKA